jgi:hypothetical protein
MIVCIGMRSPIVCDNEMYSASVVESVISLCNLDDHKMGQPAKVIRYPVLDLTLAGLSEAPAKSVSP